MGLEMRNHSSLVLIILGTLGLEGSLVWGQDGPVEKPKLEKPIAKKAVIVFVPDAGLIRNVSKRKSSQQILKSAKPHFANRLCAKTEVDGVVTYDILHAGRSVEIVEKPGGEIEVSMTRVFGDDDLDELRSENPDLYMHVRAFPKTSNGDQAVRIRVEVDVVYRSKNKSDLKKSHPNVFSIYDRYVSQSKKLPMLIVTPRIIIQDE